MFNSTHIRNILLLALLIILSYSNTLQSSFILDDLPSIVENAPIHINEFSFDSFGDILQNSFSPQRPVGNLTFALNYLAGGLDSTGYHVVNILIHILNSLMVYFIVLEMVKRFGGEVENRYVVEIALLTAGMWGLNPVQTQAVTYVVQRVSALAALFYMLAFYLYIKASAAKNKSGYFIMIGGAAFSWLLAMGSKEIAITLPAMLLLYELYFNPGSKNLKRKVIFVVVISFGLVSVYMYSRFGVAWLVNPVAFLKQVSSEMSNSEIVSVSLSERLMTEARIVFHYLSLILFPLPDRLQVIYDYPVSTSLFSPVTTLLSVTGLFASSAAALIYRKKPLISFFVLWFFINLLLEAVLVKLHLVFEHRIYLPSVGMVFLLVLGIYHAIARYKLQKLLPFALLLILFVGTFLRNNVWADRISLYEDNVKKSATYLVHYGLGSAYYDAGRVKEARVEYEKSIAMLPGNYKVLYNLALIDVKEEKWKKAQKHFEEVISLDSKNYRAHRQLGYLHLNLNRHEQALEELKKAISLNGNDGKSFNYLGALYNKLGRVEDAIKSLEKAVNLLPNDFSVYVNIGNAYGLKGMFKEAVGQLEKAERLSPDSLKVHYNKGAIYYASGEYFKSIESFKRAVAIEERDHTSRMKLALSYFKNKDLTNAIKEIQTLVKLATPKSLVGITPFPYTVLGDFLLLKKDFSGSEQAYLKAFELKPYEPLTAFKLGYFYQVSRVAGGVGKAKTYYSRFIIKADRKKHYREIQVARQFLKLSLSKDNS